MLTGSVILRPDENNSNWNFSRWISENSCLECCLVRSHRFPNKSAVHRFASSTPFCRFNKSVDFEPKPNTIRCRSSVCSSLQACWGRGQPLCPPFLPPPFPFFLHVKRLEPPRSWTVSNRFVCEGEASHTRSTTITNSFSPRWHRAPRPEHLWGESEWCLENGGEGGT